MDTSHLLGYSPDEPRDAAGAGEQHQQRAETSGTNKGHTNRSPGQVFDEQQCLENLTKLCGLIAMGVVKPAVGNAIRATLTEILRHHRASGRGDGQGALSDDIVREMLRRDPAMLNLLEGLLTQEQIDLFMREATDGHEQT